MRAAAAPPLAGLEAALAPLSPDAGPLFEHLRRLVGDAHIARLAALDYGREIDAHTAALRLLLKPSPATSRLDWHPKAVLLLGLASVTPVYGAVEQPIGADGEAICQMFAAACLLRSLTEPGNADLDGVALAAIGRLTELAFDDRLRLQREAASLLAWLLPRLSTVSQHRSFLAVGIVALACDAGNRVPTTTLGGLVEWALGEEARLLELLPLGGGTLFRFPMPATWKRIGRVMSASGVNHLPRPTRDRITEISALLI